MSSTYSIPAGFCSQKLWGLIFQALEPWAGGPGAWKIRYPSWIFIHHMWVGGQRVLCVCPSSTSWWMWFFQFHSCQTYVQLAFWWFWVKVVLYSSFFNVVVWRSNNVFPHCHVDWKSLLFKYLFIYLLLERGRKKVRETWMWVGNVDWLPLVRAPSRNWTHSPGMCSDQKLNQWPFCFAGQCPTTEPHWSGQLLFSYGSTVSGWSLCLCDVKGRERV